mgnify:CR=1 FL=1
MKRIYIILICIIISISFVSCTSNSKDKSSNNSISFTQKTTEKSKKANNNSNVEKNITAKPLDDGSNIEKVKLSFLNSAQESTYDKSAKNLIKNIKSCKDNKDIKLAEKIGTMSIKHSDDEEFTDIANLYLGADNSVYAKYIDKSNKESSYAYQIDLEELK